MIRGGDIKEQEMKWKDSNRGQEIKKKKADSESGKRQTAEEFL